MVDLNALEFSISLHRLSRTDCEAEAEAEAEAEVEDGELDMMILTVEFQNQDRPACEELNDAQANVVFLWIGKMSP